MFDLYSVDWQRHGCFVVKVDEGAPYATRNGRHLLDVLGEFNKEGGLFDACVCVPIGQIVSDNCCVITHDRVPQRRVVEGQIDIARSKRKNSQNKTVKTTILLNNIWSL